MSGSTLLIFVISFSCDGIVIITGYTGNGNYLNFTELIDVGRMEIP